MPKVESECPPGARFIQTDLDGVIAQINGQREVLQREIGDAIVHDVEVRRALGAARENLGLAQRESPGAPAERLRDLRAAVEAEQARAETSELKVDLLRTFLVLADKNQAAWEDRFWATGERALTALRQKRQMYLDSLAGLRPWRKFAELKLSASAQAAGESASGAATNLTAAERESARQIRTALEQRVALYQSALTVLAQRSHGGSPDSLDDLRLYGGALAIGVGFGAQTLINNFISGVILLFERSIRLGDIVEVGGQRGKVVNVGFRNSLIRRGDGVDVLVPNSKFLESEVVNWTLTDNLARFKVTVGAAYGSPPEKVAALIARAAREHPHLVGDLAPQVLLEEFGDNTLMFALVFWLSLRPGVDDVLVRSELRRRILALFDEAGIILAFPQRDVHLDAVRPLEVKLVSSSATAAPVPAGTGDAARTPPRP